MLTTLMILSGSSLLVLVLWGWHYVRYDIRRIKRDRFLPPLLVSEAGQDSQDQQHKWLLAHNLYYRSLHPDSQQVFLERTRIFMYYKKFEYHGLEPDPFIPLMISSAAIQLTFGLEDFRLDYFDRIYVFRTAYRMTLRQHFFEGHVSSKGIYLSWEHFIKGYQDYNDAHNVGIHEMAHALSFGFFSDPYTMPRQLRKRFNEFVENVRPLYRKMKDGEIALLDTYAGTNFNEFWAVSAESFFEKPMLMKLAEPELYHSMCKLLNQDPLEIMYSERPIHSISTKL